MLYNNISQQQKEHPDVFFTVAGDFKQIRLKSVLPKFYQHVNVATRKSNMLELLYSIIKDRYKAVPLLHIGTSHSHHAHTSI